MAVHAHSTTAPADHRALLLAVCAEVEGGISHALDHMAEDRAAAEAQPARDARGRFARRAEPQIPPLLWGDVDLDAAIGAMIEGAAKPAPVGAAPNSGDTPDAIRADLDALVADRGHMSTPEPDTASAARTLHLRRQLAQAAEHGAALLASLGLPRLVGSDFVALDPAAIGEAVDAAVAALDDLDADPDLEDGADDELSLGWEKPSSQLFLTEGAFGGDRELDTADAEPSLASPKRHPAVPISTWGRAWTARGGEEGQLRWAEGAQDDRELVPEDGAIDEDELDGAGEVDAEPSIGWPEDFTAEVEATLEASADVEHDDADLEDDVDDDPGAEPWWSFDRSTVIEVVPHV